MGCPRVFTAGPAATAELPALRALGPLRGVFPAKSVFIHYRAPVVPVLAEVRGLEIRADFTTVDLGGVDQLSAIPGPLADPGKYLSRQGGELAWRVGLGWRAGLNSRRLVFTPDR